MSVLCYYGYTNTIDTIYHISGKLWTFWFEDVDPLSKVNYVESVYSGESYL